MHVSNMTRALRFFIYSVDLFQIQRILLYSRRWAWEESICTTTLVEIPSPDMFLLNTSSSPDHPLFQCSHKTTMSFKTVVHHAYTLSAVWCADGMHTCDRPVLAGDVVSEIRKKKKK